MELETIFPKKSPPEWLQQIVETGELPPVIPLKNIATESCYYPACFDDVSPLTLTAGFVHSFICVDYMMEEKDYLARMREMYEPLELVFGRTVKREELVPPNWKPVVSQSLSPRNLEYLQWWQDPSKVFGHWSIWKKKENPYQMISVLYMNAEAVATYQGVYWRMNETPKILTIIRPGVGLGCAWTNFYDPDEIFWQTIMRGDEVPEYLILDQLGYHTIAQRRYNWGNYESVGEFDIQKKSNDELVHLTIYKFNS